MDHGLPGPGLSLQPGFQQIRLANGYIFLAEPQTHPPPALMYDGCLHTKSLLMEKGSRFPAPFRNFQAS